MPVVVSPITLEALKRIDAIFAHERVISGQSAGLRQACRQEHIVPLVVDLDVWMCTERAKPSRYADPAKAIDTCSSAGAPLY